MGEQHRLLPATPYRTLVSYKESKNNAKIDPSPIWTGTWRDNRFSPPSDGGRPENALTGTGYMNDRTNVDLGIAMTGRRRRRRLRFWRNTAVANLQPDRRPRLDSPWSGMKSMRTWTTVFGPRA